MKFLINNLYTKIENCDDISEIKKLCTFSHTHFRKFKGQKKPEIKIKKYSYFNGKLNTFPTGNLPYILENFNIPCSFEDLRIKPLPQFEKINTGIDLRDYQKEGYFIGQNKERGIFKHGCNAGKTILAVELVNNFRVLSLYIVPNLNLLNQTFDKFSEILGEKNIGFIGEGKIKISNYNIATMQTLWSRQIELKNLLESINLIILDECHKINFRKKLTENQLPWNTYYRLAMQTKNAYYRFGMTATPPKKGTLERGLLECCTGKIFHEVPQSELIEKGYSVKPIIKLYEYFADNNYNNFQESYKENIYENEKFNRFIANIAYEYSKNKKSVLIITNRVETQTEILHNLIPPSIVITGTTKNRKEKLEQFKSKKGNILISTVFDEGANIPEIDCLILACMGKSDRLTEQRVGRAVRNAKNKKEVVVVDFIIKGDSCLHRHSLERMKYYKSESSFKIEEIKNG